MTEDYEQQEKSYEKLMERKLAMLTDKRDKRQGSLIFDALAPNAAETAGLYAEMELLLDRTFADTAMGDDLTRRCMERGIRRKEPVKATFYGRFTDGQGRPYPVKKGTRFSLEGLHYRMIFFEDDGRAVLECETAGSVGNAFLGNLLPEEALGGLAEAVLTELRTGGEDREEDETLRKRYFESFEADAFGGNIADYKKRVSAMRNVGGVKVIPVPEGGGTVGITVISGRMLPPTAKELEFLQNEIDPAGKGLGKGIAPIGHKVTVTGVTGRNVSVKMRAVLSTQTELSAVSADIRKNLEPYFDALRNEWADREFLTVRISYLEAKALEAAGVLDILNCTLNGRAENLILKADEIPALGSVEVTL